MYKKNLYYLFRFLIVIMSLGDRQTIPINLKSITVQLALR